ncbi:MAG TPA: cytochrome c3 family protein [Candidatus Methanoperedens sp.]|nr:cytochrome c3 family protein [Candidatus Methanoperedens sp.]
MRFRRAGVALLFAVLLVLPARAAQGPSALEVLYPPDLTFSSEPKLKVFAFRGSNGEPVVPVVNGKAAAPLEGEMFLKGEVSLSPGFNLLQVGEKNLRVLVLQNAIMDTFRFPSGKEGQDLIFQAYRLHPALDDGCDGCHTLEEGKLKAKDQKEACYACHTDFSKAEGGKKVFLHAPVAAGECTACHDPHFATRPKLQKLEKGCFECHDPFPSNETVHRPVGNGECVACHSPHAGPAPKQLVRPGNALCLGCHESPHARHRSPEVRGTMTKVPVSFPLDNGSLACAGCHTPHQSATRRLLKASEAGLCTICHRM